MGLIALWHVESSWLNDRTHFPSGGRQNLNHWTLREVHRLLYFLLWGAPKSLQMVTAAMKLKDAYSLEGKL